MVRLSKSKVMAALQCVRRLHLEVHRPKEPAKFIDVLRAAAACCVGRVFVALIPHPREWDGDTTEVSCEELAR
ncbi:MAG: hypothetical protein AAGF92_02105 [Myxococcota bacterium]